MCVTEPFKGRGTREPGSPKVGLLTTATCQWIRDLRIFHKNDYVGRNLLAIVISLSVWFLSTALYGGINADMTKWFLMFFLSCACWIIGDEKFLEKSKTMPRHFHYFPQDFVSHLSLGTNSFVAEPIWVTLLEIGLRFLSFISSNPICLCSTLPISWLNGYLLSAEACVNIICNWQSQVHLHDVGKWDQ